MVHLYILLLLLKCYLLKAYQPIRIISLSLLSTPNTVNIIMWSEASGTYLHDDIIIASLTYFTDW